MQKKTKNSKSGEVGEQPCWFQATGIYKISAWDEGNKKHHLQTTIHYVKMVYQKSIMWNIYLVMFGAPTTFRSVLYLDREMLHKYNRRNLWIPGQASDTISILPHVEAVYRNCRTWGILASTPKCASSPGGLVVVDPDTPCKGPLLTLLESKKNSKGWIWRTVFFFS